MLPILDRERTVAPPGFNRWLVPPAALSIHLAIGQAYAFSVFNLPLTKLIGISQSAPDDWKLSTVGWIFSIAIVFLGLSAAFLGAWLEKMGPRTAMLLSALFFSSGFLVASLGVSTHQLWLVILGYGVLGGMGLGIGYISPVKTLISWFPDRPGMATGLAIMGFGGGAMIGAPLSVALMNHFQTPESLGVSETFLTMGVFYFVFMMLGVCLVRVPAANWKPNGYIPSTEKREMVTSANVSASNAIKTPQFWLLWAVLFLNVTAGIAVLSQASAMIQEMFQGRVTAAAAGGFVGLLSIFNMGGRFVWSSCSDFIGRKHTYMIFFALGAVLYSLIPTIGASQNIVLFVLGYGIILSMYGGGFATIPVYLKDLFGTLQVGAIHGRLLTAWSAAGVVGPALVNYLREYQLSQNVPKAQAYSVTMYIMAGLLVLGFIANFLVKPVDAKFATQEGGMRA
jgi:MFS family permease